MTTQGSDTMDINSKVTLETARLIMRPFRPEDAEAFFELNEDDEVLKYTGDTQFKDVEECRNFLRSYDQYERFSVGRLLVINKETQEILGWCGLKYHPDTQHYDIGYRFFKKHWGKGYATESATAAIRYGFDSLGIERITGYADKENLASIHIFDKLGMKYCKDYVEDNRNWVLYEIYNHN